MQLLLRRLPIRWQITVLHATILALVLLGCGLLLYNEQRGFLFTSAATRLRAQARPIIDARLGTPNEPPSPPKPPVPPSPRANSAPQPPLNPPLRPTLVVLARDLASRDTAARVLELNGRLIASGDLGPPAPDPPDDVVARTAQGALEERFIATVNNERLLNVMIPLWHNGQPVALVQLITPAMPIDDVLHRLALYLALGLALALAVSTILGVSATRHVLESLGQMVATTRAIAAGDLSRRVGLPPGTNEIAQLGESFDAMVARLETAFVAQRRFVADAAHELRTPLTALSSSVELLRMGATDNDPAKTERLLRYLDTELNRVIRLTNDLLTLSSLDAQPHIALQPLDLSALLLDVLESYRSLLSMHTLEQDVASHLWVQGDPDRLRQVLLNVLDNARKYTPDRGVITVHAGADEHTVVVQISDTGSGIPATALPQLFDRFYRVDTARTRHSGGSGLGLSIVQAILHAHHGSIAVDSTPGAGTTVILRLSTLR